MYYLIRRLRIIYFDYYYLLKPLSQPQRAPYYTPLNLLVQYVVRQKQILVRDVPDNQVLDLLQAALNLFALR
jgi:hypothetical protein